MDNKNNCIFTFVMRATLLTLFCFLLTFCDDRKQRKHQFQYFEFYHDNTWNTAFSLKFTQSDTFFERQHFTSRRHSAEDTAVESNASYVGQLTESQTNTLDSFVRVIDWVIYDTAYEDGGLQDGSTFRFFIRNDSLSKVIHIYGDSAPVELLRLGRWIADVKAKAKLQRVDSVIAFEHANDRLLPPPVLDIKRFKPPRVGH